MFEGISNLSVKNDSVCPLGRIVMVSSRRTVEEISIIGSGLEDNSLFNHIILSLINEHKYRGALNISKFESIPHDLFACPLPIKELCISHSVMDGIPSSIFINLINLKGLGIEFCNISTIPAEITNLRSLRVLHIENTNIEALYAYIFHMESVEKLSLSGNAIRELPTDIEDNAVLKKLYLNSNK